MSLRLHVSEQGDFFTFAPLEPLADGRAITIHSSALLCLDADSLAQFAAYTQGDVEASLISYFTARGINYTAETGIVILDMEEPADASTKFVNPNGFWQYGPADRTTCIEGWKLRIAAARVVMPKVRLTMFATLNPDDQGRDTATYLSRLAALRDDGGPQGLYDGLDLLLPILFPRFGPGDGDKWYTIEARVRQALDGSSQLKKSNGSSLPLLPIFTMRVENPGAVSGSVHNDEQLLDFDPSLVRSMLLPMELCELGGVTEGVFWVGNPTGETMPTPNPNGWTVTDYIRRINMATRYKLIREKQAAVIQAIVPVELGDRRFRYWEKNEPDFAGWAAASNGPFRTFTIVHGGDLEGEQYLDRDTDFIEHTEEVLVCYPQVRDFEGRHLDDVIDQDLTDLRKAIGRRGYANYDALGTGLHKCVLRSTEIDERQGARILRARFALAYDRSM